MFFLSSWQYISNTLTQTERGSHFSSTGHPACREWTLLMSSLFYVWMWSALVWYAFVLLCNVLPQSLSLSPSGTGKIISFVKIWGPVRIILPGGIPLLHSTMGSGQQRGRKQKIIKSNGFIFVTWNRVLLSFFVRSPLKRRSLTSMGLIRPHVWIKNKNVTQEGTSYKSQ